VTRRTAALGSAAFFALAPGTVVGLIPWWLTRWHVRHGQAWTLRVAGACLLLAGTAALVSAFARFVIDGIGTPAPLAPTERLVVRGLYRYVRNPMYIAVVASIAGQALLLRQPGLLVYAAIVAVTTHAFVVGYEEPKLRRQFGPQYAAYRHSVHRWLPRVRPWNPSAP
jgi:protein-S-isoprenylcysteine O-methyltransferase Ste14